MLRVAEMAQIMKKMKRAIENPGSPIRSHFALPSIDGIQENDLLALINMSPVELNMATTIPLPQHEEWKAATNLDSDLRKCRSVLRGKMPLKPNGW